MKYETIIKLAVDEIKDAERAFIEEKYEKIMMHKHSFEMLRKISALEGFEKQFYECICDEARKEHLEYAVIQCCSYRKAVKILKGEIDCFIVPDLLPIHRIDRDKFDVKSYTNAGIKYTLLIDKEQ